jgi:hypothetical protein
MRELTVIIATDLTNKCDLYIYDYSYSRDDYHLVSSLMKKTIDKVASSELNLSLRSTFSDMIDNTPLEYGSKFRSLPNGANLEMFLDTTDIVSNVLLCDFSTNVSTTETIPSWPVLFSINKYDHEYKGLSVAKSIRDFTTDVMSLGQSKSFTKNKLYSVSTGSDVIELPSFGSIEKFKKIAQSTCIKTKSSVIVNYHSYNTKTESISGGIAYESRFITDNSLGVNSIDTHREDDLHNEYEYFKTDNFELKIDDNSYLCLNCAKIDTTVDDHDVSLLASFYLTSQTRTLFESTLFKVGSVHTVEWLLHSSDCSKTIKSGKATVEIKSMSYKCDSSISEPILVDVLFRSIENSN